MIITTAQIQKIAALQEQAFARKALKLISEKYPAGLSKIGVSKEKEERVFCTAITAAKSYGLQFENDLMLYLECIVLLGVNFDKNPKIAWLQNILNDKKLSGESKMNEIHNHLVFFQQ